MYLKISINTFSQMMHYYLSYDKSQVSNEEGKERSAGAICYLEYFLGNTTRERRRLFDLTVALLTSENKRSRHVFS